MWSLLLLFLCACSSEEDQAWEAALALNSTEAIDSFLLEHPESKYIEEANTYKEDYAWFSAQQKNTIYHYKEFQAQYPNSKYTEEIPALLDAFKTDQIDLNDLTETTFIGKIDYGNRETQVLSFKFLQVENDSAGISFVARIQTPDISKVIDGRIDPKGYLVMFMENRNDTIMLNITDGRIYKRGNKILLESTNINQYWNLIKYTKE